MKRTKSINLDLMRKGTTRFVAKPIALMVAAYTLSSCSSNNETAYVANNAKDCADNTELTLEQCEIAYQRAQNEAVRTGPKYNDQRRCEIEFGANNCRQYNNGSSGSVFMPLMAGFLVGQMLNNHRDNYYNPVYGYYGNNSSFRGRYMMSDGTALGRANSRTIKVDKGTLTKPKPAVKRTMSRGGFGAKASAKSSWGGGKSSRRSWGG